jgi:hypothetical protein
MNAVVILKQLIKHGFIETKKSTYKLDHRGILIDGYLFDSIPKFIEKANSISSHEIDAVINAGYDLDIKKEMLG